MGRAAVASGKIQKQEDQSLSRKDAPQQISQYHCFITEETKILRENLLVWYDQNKRELPWRTLACSESDLDRRAYGVWVSEIMLQQTQVATVIDYYNSWMKTWPTLQDLARASLEEVNEKWSGLGYYSRGRRLYEGAQKVISELKGQMPRSAELLQKLLPGVGKYTAGAVASICFGQVTGVVDGNVIRVLCRLRCIGADSSTPAVMDRLWDLANTIVDPDRPGDFNQAMMELGATVCTPKKPLCTKCPLQSQCWAFKKVAKELTSATDKLVQRRSKHKAETIRDIEECDLVSGSCALCLPTSETWDSTLGVANFPRKSAKKPSRVEQTVTCVWERPGEQEEAQYMIVRRPSTGLLAGMWEFPSMLLEKELAAKDGASTVCQRLQDLTGQTVQLKELQYTGEVVHVFSHIHQTYLVYFLSRSQAESICVKEEGAERPEIRWVTKKQFLDSAVPTAMKKILKLCESKTFRKSDIKMSRKRKSDSAAVQSPVGKLKAEPGKQRTIQSFFKSVPSK
ncbi:adenine DNA glycosylase isoform X2 [Bombina bombina]|uniref:adenine DNA glycosylase isoform X2 n=1 Tax=Bombina bombina TaxID=8345 RepID=UPI00235B1905|nr:adenine DNA glycosylase isoform X2 [Bombina bombina]